MMCIDRHLYNRYNTNYVNYMYNGKVENNPIISFNVVRNQMSLVIYKRYLFPFFFSILISDCLVLLS